MALKKEMEVFDKLPKELRDALNNHPGCIDPRFVNGLYKTRGLEDTLRYLKELYD